MRLFRTSDVILSSRRHFRHVLQLLRSLHRRNSSEQHPRRVGQHNSKRNATRIVDRQRNGQLRVDDVFRTRESNPDRLLYDDLPVATALALLLRAGQ